MTWKKETPDRAGVKDRRTSEKRCNPDHTDRSKNRQPNLLMYMPPETLAVLVILALSLLGAWA